MWRKGAVFSGVAGSLALGMFCPPAGLALGVLTALSAGVLGVDRFSQQDEAGSTGPQERFVDTLPAGYEHIGRRIQQAVHQATRATAFEVAQQAVSHYEHAKVELVDLGERIVCAVYTKGGRLVEEVEIEVPLR